MMWLIQLILGAVSGLAGASLDTEISAPLPSPQTYRTLMVAGFVTLNFGLAPIPSGDFTLFLGTRLRPRRSRVGVFDWHTGIGYQGTASVGLADLYNYDFTTVRLRGQGILTHRHHITAMGTGGRKQRFFYSFGGGAIFSLSSPFGVEGETRLGYVFTRPSRVAKGVLGGQARLSGSFGGIPLPQFGLFIGTVVF